MVLLKRPHYRAALEGFLEFHRSVSIRLENPALEAPLENLPALYQAWATLEVIDALLEVAPEAGFRVAHQQLVGRDTEGVFVRLLPGSVAAVELERQADGTRARLIPERSYRDGRPLRSVSFPQRPDVAVEVTRPGARTRVYLFDPKYKLDGEAINEGNADGRPMKVDIDKMHAYRDAIRDEAGRPVVDFAAILYPGPEARFGPGIAALRAYPGQSASLEAGLRAVLVDALSAQENREAQSPPGLTDTLFVEIEPYSNTQ